MIDPSRRDSASMRVPSRERRLPPATLWPANVGRQGGTSVGGGGILRRPDRSLPNVDGQGRLHTAAGRPREIMGTQPSFVDSKLDLSLPVDAWLHKAKRTRKNEDPPCVGVNCNSGTGIPGATGCVPQCWKGSGQQCGPDGGGGWCGSCPYGSVCGAQGKCVPYLVDGGYPEFAKTPAQKQALNLLWNALQTHFSDLFSNSCEELWFQLEAIDEAIKSHPKVIASCAKALTTALSADPGVSEVAALLEGESTCGIDCTGLSSGQCVKNYIERPASPCPECASVANTPGCLLDCYFKVATGTIGCLAGKTSLSSLGYASVGLQALGAAQSCLKYGKEGYAPTATAEEFLALLGSDEWMKIYLRALDVLAVALVKGCDWAHTAPYVFLIFQAPGWAPWNLNWSSKKFFACAWGWSHLAKQLEIETAMGALSGAALLQSIGGTPGCPPKLSP